MSLAPRRARSRAVHRVVVQVGRAPAAAGRVALGEHLQDLLEFLRGEIRVGLRAAEGVEQLLHAPFAAGDFRHDLLGEHVQRLRRHADAVELAAPDAVEEGGALDEVVERQREQPPLRRRADGMARAADALEQRRDQPRRAHLADEVDVADVDAELERGGGDERAGAARP